VQGPRHLGCAGLAREIDDDGAARQEMVFILISDNHAQNFEPGRKCLLRIVTFASLPPACHRGTGRFSRRAGVFCRHSG
jgi:hypothetical protein